MDPWSDYLLPCPLCQGEQHPAVKTLPRPAEIEMNMNQMKVGGRYNWKHAPRDKLIYLGKQGAWHQFRKIGDPREVWCKVLDEELRMFEETTPIQGQECGGIASGADRTTGGWIGQP